MGDIMSEWLFNPTLGKILAVVLGVLVIHALARFGQRSLTRQVEDSDRRYRVGRFVTSIAYLADILLLTMVFSQQLGSLTVALGVAGAGVAFALQEVIASIAGWVAISVAHFYSTGDRVQLGGTMGDVVNVGILRTTLIECGQWVPFDQYNGRIVRVPNSFVFKEPVFNYSADFPFL